eukprot:7412502-Heterocapsa_arctica.AAC.1
MLIARSLHKHDVDRQMVNPSRNDNSSSSSSRSSRTSSGALILVGVDDVPAEQRAGSAHRLSGRGSSSSSSSSSSSN